MLEEKGRLIALYDPNMGHLSKFLAGEWGLPRPKIQIWNATKYKYVILLLEITHDSEENNPKPAKDITLTRSDSSNIIIVLPRRKHLSTVIWHLEVYDVFSRQTCNLAWLWCPVESSKQRSVPWADGNACELCHRHPTSTRTRTS